MQTAGHFGPIIDPVVTSSSISQQLELQSVVPMESTIPTGVTADQWRRRRSCSCDNVHETTTRYDPVKKLLTFLLVCPVCGTERVVDTQDYEPRFQPLAA